VYYTIFDSMVEECMVNSSRYLVVRIFEWVVVVAEVGEYPDLLLSMGILVTQRLSDRTRSTYFNKARSAAHDLRAWFKFEKGDKEFVET